MKFVSHTCISNNQDYYSLIIPLFWDLQRFAVHVCLHFSKSFPVHPWRRYCDCFVLIQPAKFNFKILVWQLGLRQLKLGLLSKWFVTKISNRLVSASLFATWSAKELCELRFNNMWWCMFTACSFPGDNQIYDISPSVFIGLFHRVILNNLLLSTYCIQRLCS